MTYSRFTVYINTDRADHVEDAICELYGSSDKIGYNRHLFVEKKIEEFLNQCVDEWDRQQGLKKLQGEI